MQVADFQRRGFGAAQADLQADGEKGAVAQAFDGVGGRSVEHLAGLGFGKSQGRTFVPVDGRPLHIGDRIPGDVVVGDQVLEDRR